MINQSLFAKKLKISQRLSIQGHISNQPENNKANLSNTGDKYFYFNQIQLDRDTFRSNNQKSSKLMQSALKKHIPPIMEHSERVFQSTSTYLPDHYNFKAADFSAEIKHSHKSYFKKNSNPYQFKQSQIFCPQNGSNPTNIPNDSVMDVLQKFDQKIRNQKKNQMLIIQAESSSEQQCKQDHAMLLSQQQCVSLNHRNDENKTKQLPMIPICQQKQNLLSSSSKYQFSRAETHDSKGIPKSVIKGQNLQKCHQNQERSLNQIAQYQRNQHKKQSCERCQLNKSNIFQEIKLNYDRHIQNIQQKYVSQLTKKQSEIAILARQINIHQNRIVELQLKLSQIQNFSPQLKIGQPKYNLLNASSIQGYQIQLSKLRKQNHYSKKKLQEKEELIYSLSKSLEGQHEYRNNCTLSQNIGYIMGLNNKQSAGLSIDFVCPQQPREPIKQYKIYPVDEKQYLDMLQSLIMKYEASIIKKDSTINALQNYIFQITKESIETQKLMRKMEKKLSIIWSRKQEIEGHLNILMNKFMEINSGISSQQDCVSDDIKKWIQNYQKTNKVMDNNCRLTHESITQLQHNKN